MLISSKKSINTKNSVANIVRTFREEPLLKPMIKFCRSNTLLTNTYTIHFYFDYRKGVECKPIPLENP